MSTQSQADIGVVGMAVMGQNLALNIESRGYTVAVYNRTQSTLHEFVQRAGDKRLVPAASLAEFAASLARPRKILLLVQAGTAVDRVIADLRPHLDPGDILIDGGNSFFVDTIRRAREAGDAKLRYIGTGVSGGEEGALLGPSIMPGGDREAYQSVAPILTAIAAKVEGDPCCTYIGADGAGHYVKMVHNGIEYGDMQLIAEAYSFMKLALGMSHAEMHDTFAEWNRGELDSYLIEITTDILAKSDPETGAPMVEVILDQAGQKAPASGPASRRSTWACRRRPSPRRYSPASVSALKQERVAASARLRGPDTTFSGNRDQFLNALRRALYASKICSYAQGFSLMRAAADEHGWALDYGAIAMIWRGGCIIRAKFLSKIRDAYQRDPGAGQPAPRPVLHRHRAQRATRLARGGGHRGHHRHSRAGVFVGIELLRQLPLRYAVGQHAAGAARLLRRPHLSARRPGRRVSYRMAGRRQAAGAATGVTGMAHMSYVERTFGLHDQVVALAGGGGTIALALAEAFLDAGARVAIWSRRQETVDAAVEQLGGDAGRRERLCGVLADAGDEAAVDAALQSTTTALGAPTVLLNGVGGNRGKGAFNDIDVALFEEVLSLNLVAGLVVPTKRTTAFWIARGMGGCIINVASMASYIPLSGVWAYDAAKAGVVNLTMACAKEYAPHDIRVNAIAPGFIVANQESAAADRGRCHRQAHRPRPADYRPHAVRALRRRHRDGRRRPVPGQQPGGRLHHRRDNSDRRGYLIHNV